MPVKFKKGSKEAKAHMAKIRAMRGTSTHKDTKSHNVNIKVVSGTKKKDTSRQTGKSVIEKDFAKKALAPGKRKSATGKTYYERRANRSDKPGSLLGVLGAYFDVTVINDLDTLKKEYKKLALKYHPDRGGTTAQMQSVNDEYDKLRDKILKGSKLTEDQKKNEIVIDEAIKEVINVLILIPDINIEVIGKWIWVSGNTYPVKSELKAAGLIFIKKEGKPYWVYKGIESLSRGGTPMDLIKAKYGVHKFDVKPPKSINGMPIKISSINRIKLKRSLKKLVNAINKRPI
jgi:hypothetical protein